MTLFAGLGSEWIDGLPREKPQETWSPKYAQWRLAKALRDRAPAPDHAVLLRQAARWRPGMYVGALPEWAEPWAERVGVSLRAGKLFAEPFSPLWLDEGGEIDAPPEPLRPNESLPAETYLATLRADRWLSRAQKEAAWLALTAPPPATCLIALPTGAGKSLCFQLLARAATGLTVVVVPTVALAIDQWESARNRLKDVPGLNPQYFAASDPGTDPNQIAQQVESGQCRLVFTSPEACVYGRLRGALDAVAKANRLENLILDEAHIIETWGMFFRVDFQMLSQLRLRWMADGAQIRTVLLSATFTPNTRRVLEDLYGGGGATWHQFIAQRLRPEMRYFLQEFRCDLDHTHDKNCGQVAQVHRDAAVVDCAWMLPRPAIIYTTEVDEAEEMHRRLTVDEQFTRVGLFTGETKPRDRRELLRKWAQDELDLMVATSAFGLGVDKPDVRAVVHACLPENLHRYYQEVGRGGRDGASSICILLPTMKDAKVAKGLAPKLLSEEVANLRWQAMWQTAEELPVAAAGEDADAALPRYRIRTNAEHNGLEIARRGQQNVDWNRRLILQFVRARQMKLLGMEYEKSEDGKPPIEWLTVRPLFPPKSPEAAKCIATTREEELNAAGDGLRQMLQYLASTRCVNAILQDVYAIADEPRCSGCPRCRARGLAPTAFEAMTFDVEGPKASPAFDVVYNCPQYLAGRFDAGSAPSPHNAVLRQMVNQKRIRRFACRPQHHAALVQFFGAALGPNPAALYRVDAYDGQSRFRVDDSETIVVFHMGDLDRGFQWLRQGRRVVHLVPEGARVLDEFGRAFMELDGAAPYNSVAAWMAAG